ncbi:PLP-dependent aminotransferase family protein [Thermogladius sp. 4427co]|uniref:aminotransferase-like domain-containing protein n=1 Tax=Thermogladius sp. 4427co TaxID=3450718 RepID=UPI003F79DEB0
MEYIHRFSHRINFARPSPIRTIVSKIATLSKTRKIISFAAGEPDPDILPRDLYASLLSDILKEEKLSANYSPTEGIPELRKAIAKFMREFENVNAEEDEILVTIGGSQAIDLLGRLFLDPGDYVIVENPSYVNTIVDWEFYGARLIGVNLEKDGLDLGELEMKVKEARNEARKVKLVYVIPTGNNPAGVSMSEEKRKHLLEIASRYDLLVVEDAAYNHLVYEGSYKPLSHYDREGRVIYVGSFSKIFGTGLRIGWIRASKDLVEVIKTIKGPSDMCAPVPLQYLVERLLSKGFYETIRKKAIENYRVKRDIMLKAIGEYLRDTDYTKPSSGMFVLIKLPSNIDSEVFSQRLLEEYSVAVIPAKSFYIGDSGRNVIRLNFTMVDADEIEDGIKKIGVCLRDMLGKK